MPVDLPVPLDFQQAQLQIWIPRRARIDPPPPFASAVYSLEALQTQPSAFYRIVVSVTSGQISLFCSY